MLDVIICVNFGVEKLRGLGNTRSQILEFSIEMVGHSYNRAGATAPVGYGKIHSLVTLIWLGKKIVHCHFKFFYAKCCLQSHCVLTACRAAFSTHCLTATP